MGRGQSTAVSGEMQVARVGDAFAYVRPFYVESENSNKPLLRFVEVLYRGRTGFAPTVAEAFSQAAGRVVAGRRTSGNGTGSAGGSSGSGAGGPGDGGVVDPNATQSELVAQAAEAFDAAQQALANGDLGTYQRKIDEAGALVHRANEANEANEAGALVNETATPSRSPTSAVPAPAPTTTSPPTSASAGAAAPADGAAPAEATTTSVTATKALSVSVTNNP
jgi:hypothetical protein